MSKVDTEHDLGAEYLQASSEQRCRTDTFLTNFDAVKLALQAMQKWPYFWVDQYLLFYCIIRHNLDRLLKKKIKFNKKYKGKFTETQIGEGKGWFCLDLRSLNILI